MRELDFEYFSFGREQVRAAAAEAARNLAATRSAGLIRPRRPQIRV